MPDSCISCQRSLPSRVRSPTPANTDTPPCFNAMLWISSMITTVLPTPAPPKRPILPPLRYGSSRSMTLMPVSNISSLVDWSSSDGAAQRLRTHRYRDGGAGVDHLHAALETVGGLHGNRADAVLADVLLDLADDV